MVDYIFFIPIVISFIITISITPYWIKKCRKIGLLWEDMNKYQKTKDIAISGGIIVVLSFIIGALLFIALKTFLFPEENLMQISLNIFSLLSVVLILTIVGITDDILGWKQKGLSTRIRIVLAFLASIPLVVINAGDSNIFIPYLGGSINIGLIYPLILIPIGIAGATTVYNFLAGFNGLEAGQGVIILSFLSLIAFLTGQGWLAVVGLCMVASLIGFLIFNKYPAKIFPGDSLTWPVGALIAGIAIVGDFERIAFFIFIPYILEFVLKTRGKLRKQSFGIPNEDGSLELPYKRFYGLTHVSIFLLKKIKKKVYEKDVVYLIWLFQLIICLTALIWYLI